MVSYENSLYNTFPLQKKYSQKKNLGQHVTIWEAEHNGMNEGFGARQTAWI